MITVIGLGPGGVDDLSRRAFQALREGSEAAANGSGVLVLRTSQHPCVDALINEGIQFESYDSLYESASDFQSLYTTIASKLITLAQTRSVFYAVPGNPYVGEETVRILLELADTSGIELEVIPSAGFVEAVLIAAKVPQSDGYDVRDALTLSPYDMLDADGLPTSARIDTTRGLILFQVYNVAAASQAKLSLMREYPDEWQIAVVIAAGVKDRETVQWIPLFKLDRMKLDHLTSVYIPPLPPNLRPRSFETLVGLMARLRADDGCPWDREQDHRTLRKSLIEETYEVLDAIEENDADHLCEELGDLLLQVVFHSQLAMEDGAFTIDDVTNGIVSKLLRRHPHVFGNVQVSGTDDVLKNWDEIKRQERADKDTKTPSSLLHGIPGSLPALMEAAEISKRAVKVGFEWPDIQGVMAKIDEEIAELKDEIFTESPDVNKIEAELGDLIFTLVQVARWFHLDAENALRSMLVRFRSRFQYMEEAARQQNRELQSYNAAELNTMWENAKRVRKNESYQ